MEVILIKTIEKNIETEIVEKKSRFIANAYHVESKKEAEELIEDIKNKYRDAKHNCFAFSVYEDNQKYTKCSDDGEPSGTAGVPILNVIEKRDVTNILIVVTRYFGGILLGTGGLTRAYSLAATTALDGTEIVEMIPGVELNVKLSYQDSDNFKNFCEKNKINITNVSFDELVSYNIEMSEEIFEKYFNDEKYVNNMLAIQKYSIKCRKYIKKEE